MSKRISGANIIMQSMSDLGADTFFCLPGRGIYPLINQMVCFPGLRYVNALHEFALTSAADGYARASGKAAFVSLYMSTGVMNASSAIFMAHRDKIPMVIIATQTESSWVSANARAESDGILDMVKPITKWAWQPPSAGRIQEAIVRAHTIATTPPYGPTFIAVPVDFFDHEVNYVARSAAVARQPGEFRDAPDGVVRTIAAAERPVVIVGGETIYTGGADAVTAFADATGVVVLAEPDPPFLPINTSDPRYGGELGANPALVTEADVVIHAGVNTLERPYVKAMMHDGQTHIHIGHDPKRVNEHMFASHFLNGDPGVWLHELARAVLELNGGPKTCNPAALLAIAEARATRLRNLAQVADASPMSVSRVFAVLRETLPANATIVEHATTGAQLFRRTFDVADPTRYIASSGSNQGWGVGAVVGAKIARPDTPVVAVVGDGGMMFNVQALQMSVMVGAPVIYVVLNNGGWASMMGSVAAHAPNVAKHGVDLGYGWSVDFAAMAKSLGAQSIQATNACELKAAVEKATKAQKSILIEVFCAHLFKGIET
ncbi:MAG: thiamine pyrophosphate-binding protein [Devosia sp.]|nr:thiamine pyrophosphate-binding protein [Devosia sp.]